MMVGATVNADIVTSAEPMFIVPQEAILSKLDKTFVFIIKNGKAVQTEVVTGYMEADNIQITGDFQDGDQMVVQGAFKLSDGVNVITAIGSGEIRPKGNSKQQTNSLKNGNPTYKTKKDEGLGKGK